MFKFFKLRNPCFQASKSCFSCFSRFEILGFRILKNTKNMIISFFKGFPKENTKENAKRRNKNKIYRKCCLR